MQLNISRLPQKKKRFVWQWLNENRKDIVEWLSDEFVQCAQKTFNGEIIIDLSQNEINDMKKKFAKLN